MKSDRIRLQHMLDAAKEAMDFAKAHGRSDLNTNRMLTLALVKSIEIVGEAASKLGPELRAQYPDIPWQDIVGMRNRLIHAYFDVDLDRVWDTVTDDLPPLTAALDAILKNE